MLTTRLYPYQVPAVQMFLEDFCNLLGADMGTGKTVIALAIAEELLGRQEIKRTVIICPTGLKYQWAQEIAKHTDVPSYERQMGKKTIIIPAAEYCTVVDGDPDKRRALIQDAYDLGSEYIIVPYDAVVSDYHALLKLCDGLVVIDEASVMKNPGPIRSRAMKAIDCPYRLALTGTPVENRPEELFSIMEWVDSELFGDFEKFDRTFIVRDNWGNPVRYKNLDALHRIISKRMFRITADHPDVARYMPSRSHRQWQATMSTEAWSIYALMARYLLEQMEANPTVISDFDVAAHYGGYDESTPDGKLMSVHQAMLMYCDHPHLLVASAQKFAEGKGEGSKFAHELVSTGVLDNLTTSRKLNMVAWKVNKILKGDPDSKVIVFSQYREMLPLLGDSFHGYPAVFYHGGMTATAKTIAQSSFENDPDVRLFLASHAGAYGLDLPAANWLINYDQPWAHGKRVQINRRHVRASSQHEEVQIVDVLVRGSVEERRLAVVDMKGGASDAIVDGQGASGQDWGVDARPMSLKDHLRTFLHNHERKAMLHTS